MLENLKYFNDFAVRAAGLEKMAQWQFASVYWEKAAYSARNQANRDWAECRAEVCRRRLCAET